MAVLDYINLAQIEIFCILVIRNEVTEGKYA